MGKRFLHTSSVGLWVVIEQGNQGEEQPILYLNHKLFPWDTKYFVVEEKGLAIKWALESL